MTASTTVQPRRWFHWYAPTDTPEEKKLILKLDALIIPYAFILYWIKYMDQNNISKLFALPILSILLLTIV
jgi:hypothetical protein